MKSAITLSQVPEAAAGPFVFHQSLPEGFSAAKKHGYDSVELFLPGPDFISAAKVKALASEHDLGIAAVGTGAGMVKHGLSLTDVDAEVRGKALDFIIQMIEFGGQLDAPAILGSMQGKWGGEVSREQALNWLAEALRTAGKIASKYNVPFIYEPLNRYETNLINHLEEGARYIEDNNLDNIVLLADLFHMNIEESDIAESIIAAGKHTGHVHFADSNRSAMGFGHTDTAPIIAALRKVGYTGYLSAEVFPKPDPDTCAAQEIKAIQRALT
ncbi:sugar phosphate isomerase/epimerase [bacterium]|nr:sugar phosphate isomerase/epimerase [Akkermansiaceae bacterium]MDA7679331.1 sugar phosphate isomerase/epimerase [Akkermansiaceae bacterium]MDB4362212.1 sugar phosphate isomerase/epimerase [Akkermansiaceae bacterium]MDB4463865.1 sugar phosphate isomerase/epimerase [Akkermansiaceae bacterium]MDB4472522.1 sugar phosphate isomerase/epimerase [bacterium]